MREKLIAVMIFAAITVGVCSALAFEGTVNRVWQENFQVLDVTGTGRTNCSGSRFTLKVYKDGSPATLAASYRNYTSGGNYNWTVTPSQAGRYSAFLSYSGTPVGAFCTTVRAYDVDTQYAVQDTRFTNISAVACRRPVNPLLATDSRIPATLLATSVEVAKSADWTSARAAKVDNLDAAVSTRATSSGVWSATGRTLTDYSGVDTLLKASHGSGLWTADGGITVLPFQGAATYETVSQGREVHIVRGDSVSIPYSVGKDVTGWSVWFGAKAKPSDTVFDVPLREITSSVTDVLNGSGLIKLSTTDTAVPAKRYFAEVELRKGGDISTGLKFNLWIDADVIR